MSEPRHHKGASTAKDICTSSDTLKLSFLLFCLGLSEGSKLLGFLDGEGLGTLVQLGLGLESHDTSSPSLDKVGVVIVRLVGQIGKDTELRLVFLSNTGDRDTSGDLLVDQSSQSSLVLDNHERDLHLSAKGRHPHDEFDRIDIAGDENKLCLLLFDKSGDVLESELDNVGCLAAGIGLSSGLGGSGFLEALLLGRRGLRSVLVEKSEDSHGLVLSKSLGELVDRRRDLQSLVENSSLTLDADILGPLDESTQVTSLGSDVSSNSEGLGLGRVERIGGLLGRDRLGLLLASLLWCHLEKFV